MNSFHHQACRAVGDGLEVCATSGEDGLIEVRAQIWAERESQKAILIGKGGKMVRDVGAAARSELERELGTQVYLDLSVRVRPKWRRDDALLDRLGIE